LQETLTGFPAGDLHREQSVQPDVYLALVFFALPI